MSGNNVSHAENRTRRKFMPNIQQARFYSETLARWVPIKITTAGIRTLEHKGGLDAYLKNTAKTKLDPALRKIKVQIENALSDKKSA